VSVEITELRGRAHVQSELQATIAASELLLFCHDLRGTVTDALVAATGRALALHPGVAGAASPAATGIGVTVDTGDRVLVPVVRNATEAPLPLVRAEVERVVDAARAGRLSPDDLGGAAVTVHDPLPGAGATPPEALQGFVLVVDRPACDSPELTLALSIGGSGSNGDEAGPFFATLVRLLQHPYRRLV
jgi:pyruvate/2-oxoglutarate dehydrogenase complex dihydrolipoamide acyltransferase (E2) component